MTLETPLHEILRDALAQRSPALAEIFDAGDLIPCDACQRSTDGLCVVCLANRETIATLKKRIKP